MTDILDKDLPSLSVTDIKLDVSAVDSMDEKTQTELKKSWVCSLRTNEQLVGFLTAIPEKVTRLQVIVDEGKDLDGFVSEKIRMLKEEYALAIKEIEARKAAAIEVIG